MKKMQKKVNTSSLYVGFKMAEIESLIKPFEQYVSPGDILHSIVVTPERVLLTLDENGCLFNAVTRKKVRINEATKSFHTKASVIGTLRCQVADPDFPYDKSVAESVLRDYGEDGSKKLNQVGLIISFSEYIKNVLHLDISDEISIRRARYLLSLASILHGKKVVLDENEQVASEQIEELYGKKRCQVGKKRL